jgi:AAA domain
LLSGQWGTYKTFVAIDMAVSVISGHLFIDLPIKRRGGVLFIAAEGQTEVAIRLQAALEAKCNLAKGERAPFAWIDSCPRLLDKNALKELTALAKEAAERMQVEFGLPLALIIIDTIGRTAGYEKSGDENDAVIGFRIMKVLSMLSAHTGAFVLGLDHFGKAVETGTRGTSSKEGDVDVVLALLGDKDIGGAISNTRLCARKRRSGPNGEEFPFYVKRVDMGVDEDGDPITTLTVDWTAVAQSRTKTSQDDEGWTRSLRLLRRVLMNVLVDHGTEQQPFVDGPVVRAVDLESIRPEFYRSYPAEGDEKAKQAIRQKAFRRAINTAQSSNLIGVRDINGVTFVWLARIQDTAPAPGAYGKDS